MCETTFLPEIETETKRTVDALSAAAPPNVLYHYTSAEGLLGIVESGLLHFTHAFFMNDQSELLYGRDLVVDVLQREIFKVADRRKRLLMSACLDIFADMQQAGAMDSYHCYLACFCEDGNLLSQRRAYGDTRQGYAVGFLTDQLLVGPDVLQLRRVRYHRGEQEALINAAVDRCFTACLGRMARVHDRKARHEVFGAYVFAISVAIATLLPQLKHPMFAEEKEWRLIALFLDSQSQPNVKFRRGRSSVVPYSPINLTKDREGATNHLPIASVTHAPCAEPEIVKRSIRMLLAAHGYGDEVPVVGSDIPLRST